MSRPDLITLKYSTSASASSTSFTAALLCTIRLQDRAKLEILFLISVRESWRSVDLSPRLGTRRVPMEPSSFDSRHRVSVDELSVTERIFAKRAFNLESEICDRARSQTRCL